MSIASRTTGRGERRYDVRLRRPDNSVETKTFRTRREAEAYERAQRTAQDRGLWTDPRAGRISLTEYSSIWLSGRTVRGRPLALRTVEGYRYLLDHHILPTFGAAPMSRVTPDAVRAWYRDQLRTATKSVPPKAYRVLHAIFATAVDDGLVGANPCRIKGAGTEHHPERPIVTPEEVAALADGIEPRWRAMVLVAAYGQLRFGELVGLRRRDVDLRGGTVMVDSQLVEPEKGIQERTRPKSDAGRRSVTLPAFVVDELRRHLIAYVEPDVDAPVFAGPYGGLPRRRNWARIWSKARTLSGVADTVHLHDLRHLGATLAAQSGGTTKEVMARLGHASPRAALIYQHAVPDRDRAIAHALDAIGRTAAGTRQTGEQAPPPDGHATTG